METTYLAAQNSGTIVCLNCANENISEVYANEISKFGFVNTVICIDDNYDVLGEGEVKDLKNYFPNLCNCEKENAN